MDDIIDKLIEIRKRQGISQTELAKRIGKTQQVVSRIENKSVNPSLEYVCSIVKALGYELQLKPNKNISEKGMPAIQRLQRAIDNFESQRADDAMCDLIDEAEIDYNNAKEKLDDYCNENPEVNSPDYDDDSDLIYTELSDEYFKKEEIYESINTVQEKFNEFFDEYNNYFYLLEENE